MLTCPNCGKDFDGKRDICNACLRRTPACIICGRAIDDHSLTYSKDKYPQPICPKRGQSIVKGDG